jgi:hypothetical protein
MSTHNVQEELRKAGVAPRGETTIAAAGDIDLDYPVTVVTTGAGALALGLPNGVPGQKVTVTLGTAGGGTATITPATMTGWATALLVGTKDTFTFGYIDDTVGWVVIGGAGTDADPLIT